MSKKLITGNKKVIKKMQVLDTVKFRIKEDIKEHINAAQKIIDTHYFLYNIFKAAELIFKTIKQKKFVFIMGNGGSAADAQHFAAELNGRFEKERIGLPAIALTTNTSTITAIANDYSFNEIFSRQIESLARKDDLLIFITTSGKSKNILNAKKTGEKIGCKHFFLTGDGAGKIIKDLSDYDITIPSKQTATIQEMHIMIIHIICRLLDHWISKKEIY